MTGSKKEPKAEQGGPGIKRKSERGEREEQAQEDQARGKPKPAAHSQRSSCSSSRPNEREERSEKPVTVESHFKLS